MLERARAILNARRGAEVLHSWPQNDVAGRFLVDPVYERLEGCDLLVADIT